MRGYLRGIPKVICISVTCLGLCIGAQVSYALDDDWPDLCDQIGPPPEPLCEECPSNETICIEGEAPQEDINCPLGTVENIFGICVDYDAEWPDTDIGGTSEPDTRCRRGYTWVAGRCILDPLGDVSIDCPKGQAPVLDDDFTGWHCEDLSPCESCQQTETQCLAEMKSFLSACLDFQSERARALCSPDIKGIRPGSTWKNEPIVDGSGVECVYEAVPNTEYGGMLYINRCTGYEIDRCIKGYRDDHPGTTIGNRITMNAGVEKEFGTWKISFGGGGMHTSSESWGGAQGFESACKKTISGFEDSACSNDAIACRQKHQCSTNANFYVIRDTVRTEDGTYHIIPHRNAGVRLSCRGLPSNLCK